VQLFNGPELTIAGWGLSYHATLGKVTCGKVICSKNMYGKDFYG
jgi:hypothetical protein